MAPGTIYRFDKTINNNNTTYLTLPLMGDSMRNTLLITGGAGGQLRDRHRSVHIRGPAQPRLSLTLTSEDVRWKKRLTERILRKENTNIQKYRQFTIW